MAAALASPWTPSVPQTCRHGACCRSGSAALPPPQQAPPLRLRGAPARLRRTSSRLAAAFSGRSNSGSGNESSSMDEYARSSPTSTAVDIAIEPGPANSRCIWAGVDVAAPAPAVYAALTSYESLGIFIPGLAENRCMERYPDGCKLLQVGQQDVALGLRFRARVCLRITEHSAGIPPRMLARSPNARPSGGGGGSGGSSGALGFGGTAWWPFGSSSTTSSTTSSSSGGSNSTLSGSGSGSGSIDATSAGSSGSGEEDDREFSEQCYLQPRSPLGQGGACMDVAFQLLEGDFAAFTGLWRVQPASPTACRLSYTLFVRPQPWLLVGLIEQRIQAEIGANLAAVKAHVERQQGSRRAAGGPGGPAGAPPPG